MHHRMKNNENNEWQVRRHGEKREVWQEVKRHWELERESREDGQKKLFEEVIQNNTQIEELEIVPRYIIMKLQNTKNKEKG